MTKDNKTPAPAPPLADDDNILLRQYRAFDTADYDSSDEATDALLEKMGLSDLLKVLRAEDESRVLSALRAGARDHLWANRVQDKLDLAGRVVRDLSAKLEAEREARHAAEERCQIIKLGRGDILIGSTGHADGSAGIYFSSKLGGGTPGAIADPNPLPEGHIHPDRFDDLFDVFINFGDPISIEVIRQALDEAEIFLNSECDDHEKRIEQYRSEGASHLSRLRDRVAALEQRAAKAEEDRR